MLKLKYLDCFFHEVFCAFLCLESLTSRQMKMNCLQSWVEICCASYCSGSEVLDEDFNSDALSHSTDMWCVPLSDNDDSGC